LTGAEPRFNPFPGLRPFEADEDHLFFGREREIDELVRRLRTARFLSVIGASGSGKSSLIRSGLIPALYSGAMVKAGASWRIALFRPGEDPIGNLAAALGAPDILGADPQLAGTANVLLEATLRRSSRGLADAVRLARLPAHDNVLVVVDQFEELFRFRKNRRIDNSRDEAVAFVKLLLHAAAQDGLPVYIVITMRSDFIGDCMEYPGLPEAVNSGQYLVPRMQRDALRLAITGPVAVGGGTITPRLVLRLLNDIGDDIDQLPVLQHALMRTWDRWAQRGKPDDPIDIGDYEDVGTLRQALSMHAEETYAQSGSDRAKQIAERMFRALTDTFSDSRGVRRPTAVADLAAICQAEEREIVEIVEVFRRPGRSFLMPPARVPLTPATIVDLSHESLMRCWDRLVRWADEERTAAAFYVRLSQAAAWHAQGVGGLWAEPELDLGLQWKARTQPTEAWARRYNDAFAEGLAFLNRSAAERDRIRAEHEADRRRKLRQARGAAAVFAVLSVIAGYLAYLAWAQSRRAENNLAFARAAVDETLSSADVDPAHAGADVPQMAEFRRELLEKAKRFYVDFLEANPPTRELRAEMASANVRLGHINRMLEKPDDAAADYQRAVEQFATLDRQHPSIDYKRALADAYNWLGETFRPLPERAAMAASAYDSAVQIQRGLAADNPGQPGHQQELARTHYNRGILRSGRAEPGDARFKAAESDFREAVRLLEPLQKQAGGSAGQELARAYNNLGSLVSRDNGRLAEARGFYERAIAIDEGLLRGHPENRQYKFELATFNNNAADVLRLLGQFEPARERHRRALDLLQDLARPSASLGIALADSHTLLGTILEDADRDPLPAFRRAFEQFERLERDPSALRLRQFHWRFGELLLSLAARAAAVHDDSTRRLLREALDRYLALATSSAARGATAETQMIRENLEALLPELGEPERRMILDRHPELQGRSPARN
jgi:tetratricopeptide (TPR) repeat protein